MPDDQHRRFGRTDLRVSPLGFGGAPIGLLETGTDDVAAVLNGLLDAGVNVVDTAACYYGSEEMIGRAIGRRRGEYVLVSKCGHARAGESGPADFTAATVTANIDRSLERLATDHLDVVLLHSCDLETLRAGEALGAAVAARDAGKVRFVGYSGDNEAAAWAAAQPDVAVLQTSVSICDQANVDAVLPVAREHDVGVMAKRPIANAAWKAEHEQYERYRSYAKPYHDRFREMGLSLEALGLESLGWPEVALRFTLGIPGVHTAIIGTTKPAHVEANRAAASAGPLPDEAVARIRAAFRPGWPGLT